MVLVFGMVLGVYVVVGGMSIKFLMNQLVCSNLGYVYIGWSIDGVYYGLGVNYVMYVFGFRKVFVVWLCDCWVEYLVKVFVGVFVGVIVIGILLFFVKVVQNLLVILVMEV